MTNPLIPQTKLDAVNQMLASIGQTPLNTLNTSGIRDAAIAELSLDNTTREVLNRGWSFNTDREFEISRDVNDNYLVPSDALQIDPEYHWLDWIERDNSGTRMMYDRENNTFDITTENDPVLFQIIRAMDFETLPQAARGYIAIRAARIFQANVIGSDILFKYTEMHEREALSTLKKLETRSKDRNMFRPGTESNKIVNRWRNPLR